MSLPVASVWEVRPTVGNDTNGGGFVAGAAGTDYSQQNSKNSGGTNGSTTDGVTSGTGLTSATGSYSSAIVGNILYLSGTGVTTGWYQALSFSSGTVTLDRSPGNGTGITVNIGGALSTMAQVITNMASTDGMICYVKATGTITTTSAQVLGITAKSFIGYTSSRGDNGRVTWTTSTNSITLVDCGQANTRFWNFNFTCTAGTPGDGIRAHSGGNCGTMALRNCVVNGFNVGLNGNEQIDWGILNLILEFSEVKSCVSHGILNTGRVVLFGSTVHNNGGAGIELINGGGIPLILISAFSAIKSNTSHGVTYIATSDNDTIAMVNTNVVSNGGDGVRMSINSGQLRVAMWNNIFYGNTGYHLNYPSNPPFCQSYQTNAFGANGTGVYNNGSGDTSDITLTADPFTSRTGTPPDLSLNATSGGGVLCKGVATPATLPFS